ncbi:MAG: hypothetical protein E7494_03675 [Ruminococcus albus]|jgi:hypothetical protein|nr:hypothetical protein [Ruminococcus albus]
MKKTKLISQYSIDLEKTLTDWFYSNTDSRDGVFIKKIIEPKRKVMIFIAEDYYHRISSTLTLTVIVEQTLNQTSVEVVSSGGKEGYHYFSFSYGAEQSAVNRIVNFLKVKGFTEIESD